MGPRALKLLAVLTMLAALAGAVAIAVWSQTSAFLVERGPSVTETVVVLPRGAGLDEITVPPQCRRRDRAAVAVPPRGPAQGSGPCAQGRRVCLPGRRHAGQRDQHAGARRDRGAPADRRRRPDRGRGVPPAGRDRRAERRAARAAAGRQPAAGDLLLRARRRARRAGAAHAARHAPAARRAVAGARRRLAAGRPAGRR